MSDIKLNASVRSDEGKGASRRLRRLEGRVPGIVYGGEAEPQSISVLQKDLLKAQENEAFFSSVLSLDIDGKEEKVILRDLQRHPAKPILLHVDFQRVSANTKVHLKVPLHFLNEDTCKGVKAGGIVSHTLTELDISAPASKLPEFIEVDLADLDIDGVLHISDIKLPEGTESVDLSHGPDHDLVVASVHKPRGAVEAEAEAAEGEGEE
ncbi:50S ribosomal protein L25/general stress protein Ctc [Microbulbifer thermotolerans]|uniref:Large ribosomal subunit protein bL25 n=1 Tax=Microbulbifer thermotolerans TaxID=252514 RepID=A0A143HJW0_MICTH|nr:50S ribosomal protein L25/general stress protein Ctc [Microbulbifer thermotolerans]AMX01999.1 50S ribosomal protein L25/general stress protein Ctc [Microbulbifer thermotolerans]MCX2794260.1 50S ribosomal protein L25/general stress protein Ctc [Microbulbifer thermotolerans]MCX2830021.1 50S ribosomal protein L25/general stress protein Ctc [Microbulbifer thermotolerans]MCX2834219.1 50S ribosomal protein L25/general stress protein Ctc [Microbulbifer thermotolerans]WKT61543.1 50S ribosomal prote